MQWNKSMSDFDSGNSVNCVLLDVNLYETKRENNWSPIPISFNFHNVLCVTIDGDKHEIPKNNKTDILLVANQYKSS